MTKANSPDWKAIKEDYIKLNGNINLKEFAEKHGVKYSTLRSRKNREEWDKEIIKVATKDATKKKNVAINKNKNVTQSIEKLEEAELTEKQRLFCLYYIKSFNATMAAIKAGYAKSGAHVEGHRLLKNAKVSTEIKRLKGDMQQEIYINSSDILNKYIAIAFADMSDYAEFGNKEKIIGISDEGDLIKVQANYIDLKDANEVDGSLISEIKASRQGVSIKLEDRMKAMDWLSKFFEMNPEHQYKKAFDDKKLQLDRDRFNHQKDLDERNVW